MLRLPPLLCARPSFRSTLPVLLPIPSAPAFTLTSPPRFAGTLTQPPSPLTVHPEFITDAHTAGEPLELEGSDAKVKPPVTGSVAVSVGKSKSGYVGYENVEVDRC